MQLNDLKRLLIFVQVVSTGSFTDAAKRLKLPRSSVSEQISALEKSLGMRLLQRTTRKLSLTHEGKQVFDHAQSIQGMVNQIDTLGDSSEAFGVVKITITTDLAELWLIPLLIAFNKKHPDIYVQLIVNDFSLDLVAEEIDLALRVAPKDNNLSLVGRTLKEEPLCLYASTAYLEKYGMPQEENLLQHHWITLQQVSPNGELLLQANQPHKIKLAHYHETNSPQLLRVMVEQGIGIGLMLPSIVKNQIKQGFVQRVLPHYCSPTFQISLVYPSRQLPLRTRLLADYLVNAGWI